MRIMPGKSKYYAYLDRCSTNRKNSIEARFLRLVMEHCLIRSYGLHGNAATQRRALAAANDTSLSPPGEHLVGHRESRDDDGSKNINERVQAGPSLSSGASNSPNLGNQSTSSIHIRRSTESENTSATIKKRRIIPNPRPRPRASGLIDLTLQRSTSPEQQAQHPTAQPAAMPPLPEPAAVLPTPLQHSGPTPPADSPTADSMRLSHARMRIHNQDFEGVISLAGCETAVALFALVTQWAASPVNLLHVRFADEGMYKRCVVLERGPLEQESWEIVLEVLKLRQPDVQVLLKGDIRR